jgi:hypothetical protein
VTALNRIILALAMVLSFGLHGAMQCQGASIVSAASDHCSREHHSCPHRSMPASPVKSCCANSVCLTYAQCSGIEDATIVQTETAQSQPVSARVSIFPLASAELSARVALRFHSPPAQVPFFVTPHAFLI